MTESPLDALAHRASADPFFLGFRLAEFARVHELDDAALARRLGCDPELLATIRLCRAPRTDPSSFREDILGVATKFGIDPLALAEAAKYIPTAPQRDEPTRPEAAGAFLAARDRETPP